MHEHSHKLMVNQTPMKGVHYILDVYGYDVGPDESAEWWKSTLLVIFKNSPLIVLHHHFHNFSPHGLTGFLLLSASHLSIHTWPEHRYIAIDLFSCLGEKQTLPVLDALLSRIPHSSHNLKIISRGYQPEGSL